MKPRILFNAKDHPDLNSGYGIASRYLLPRLGDHYGRENIFIYAPVYQRDHVGEWDGMKVLPGVDWSFGENMILQHYQNYDCNLLLQVGDAWPLGVLPDLASQDKLLWVQWIPVDWLGMPKNIYYRIKPAYKLVPFTKYGENALRKAGLPSVEPAIWLGLDTDLWKPMGREEFPTLMRSLGYSWDSFNLLIVAANQIRKQVRPMLEGISIFRKLRPEVDVRLYLHSHLVGERDLRADLDELGLNEITAFPEPYILQQGGFEEDQMVKVFNCADVVLNVCLEGFGLSQTQAQACGVPVLTLNEGPGPELVQFGIEIPVLAVDTAPQQFAQPLPNPAAIGAALEDLWNRQVENGAPLRSEAAVRFIQENFSWDKIASQWFDVIDRCMEDRVRYCLQIPSPSPDLDTRASKLVEVI